MPTDKQIIAFKIGARARKMAEEDCIVEGYEILSTALAESKSQGDLEMIAALEREMTRYEGKFLIAET
jgi:hypothetical protein